MNLSSLFIRRPVMTALLMLAVAAFGIIAFRQLPVSDLPNVDFPTIQVSASLPGASPQTMASSIATPLERQFSTIAGLSAMNSASTLGSTLITLQFDLSRNLDGAALDVQTAISRAAPQLPPELLIPPTFQKVNPADQPIIYIALTSPTQPLSTLDELGETLMAQQISTISGVAQVLVFGSQKYAVRLQLDPRAMSSRQIGIDEVSQAVADANVNLPTGVLYGPFKSFVIYASGQLLAAQKYRPIIVAYRNGAPVRLDDIGSAIDSVENDKTAAWYCTPKAQERSVILAVQRQPGTNTVEVAGRVKALLPKFGRQLPPSVSLHVLYDRSVAISNSVHDVETTLLVTLGLVILVIYLFLRSLRATIIPALALPLAVLGTFAVMYLLNYSLDNLSLLALTLSVGFVVDDAIVMLENIVRHREMGKTRLQAAFDASGEVSFTILSMTLSLAAVFLPVLFMPGLVGRLFREFGVTIGVAVLISGAVALTLTPMISSRLLSRRQEGRSGERSGWLLRRSLAVYDRSLLYTLRHRYSVLLISAAILAATFYLFGKIPKGFLPSEDRAQIFGFVEAEEGISYDAMVQHQRAVNDLIQKDPNVESFMSSAGARGAYAAPNSGFLFLRLTPRSRRSVSADDLVVSLRQRLAKIPGVRVYLQNPPTIQVGGRLTQGQYQYTLQGTDTAPLYDFAAKLEQQLRQQSGFVDVVSDLRIKTPQTNVELLRDRASKYLVTARQIEEGLYDAYGSRWISTIYAPSNEYQVILELLPEFQRDPNALTMLYIRNSSGDLVPLSAVAKMTSGAGPLSVNHSGQLPSVTISFNLLPGVSLGDAVGTINRLTTNRTPPTVSGSFQGAAQAFQAAQANLGLLLLMAVLVIYLILGMLYESYVHPLTILTALPFAGFGALLTLLVFGEQLSIYAFVGIIMLVGLVKKNGIMMIDFAIASQKDPSISPEEAIRQACLIRFRPIMMTTFAAMMAGLPIAAGWGAGAESRRPLGLAIVGGLLFSQTLTLYVTPVFYVQVERLRRRFRRRRQES